MLRFSRLFLVGFLLLPLAAVAQIDYPKDAFRDLRRGLEGTWFMPTDRGDRLEIWESADDNTLVGRSVRIKPENGDTVLIERLRLELRDTTVTYIVIARGQNNNEPVPFKLTDIDDQGFYIFSNPEHDDPQKIKYLLLSNREVQVVTEGRRNGRTVTQEYVFEREFTPGAVEFRIKGGFNAQTIRSTGNFPPSDLPDQAPPSFGWKPGWELGTQIRFKGRGGFITINTEIGLVGKFAHAKSSFFVDTSLTNAPYGVQYTRDVTYNTIWLVVGVLPEISFSRDGRFSLMAGPYYGRLIGAKGKGEEVPDNENKLFRSNNDFKKNDFGLTMGAQYRLNFGKKDLGGILGIRANLGLSNLDNLYNRFCADGNSAYCNGSVSFQGATLYYSVDLLKL
jgi:Outer membrane protein beta-barrel domain/Domain of unknown function (DUF6265)